MTEKLSNRISSLDGLRAFSILLVLFAHSEITAGFPAFVAQNLNFEFGTLGVRVFFVISGFLITTLLVREEQARGRISLSAFYKRRFLRILPAYYFYIFALFIVTLFAPVFSCPVSTYLSAATFTTFLWGYWGSPTGFDLSWPLVHTWSLSVEEQFYLLWPTLLILIPPGLGRRRFAVIFIIGFSLLMRMLFLHFGVYPKILFEHIFLTQADSLMFGCLLALSIVTNRSLMNRIFSFHPPALRAFSIALIA